MPSKTTQIIGSLLVLCLVCGCSAIAVKESTPSNSIKEHSVWQGTCDQTGWKPYPMILFIQSRKGNTFEATTWYPTLRNGLCKVSGQISQEGVVTFTEDEVIHGAGDIMGGGIMSGSKFTATIEGNSLKGGYVITLPGTGETDKGNIFLTLAD